MRRNPLLALRTLVGTKLAVYDDSGLQGSNETILDHYRARAKARLRQRVGGIVVLCRAWSRSEGRPDRASGPPSRSRAAALAHMLQLRRVCRVRDGVEVVEPFGRATVAFLGCT